MPPLGGADPGWCSFRLDMGFGLPSVVSSASPGCRLHPASALVALGRSAAAAEVEPPKCCRGGSVVCFTGRRRPARLARIYFYIDYVICLVCP